MSATAQTLFSIEDTLLSLENLRDEAEHEGDSEALAAIDKEIEAYLTHEASKINSIAGYIHHCEHNAELAREEAKRIAEHAAAWEARAKRIKASSLRAMQNAGVRVLETPTATLRVQQNGGLQPLEVFPEQVHDEYRIFRLALSYEGWMATRAATGPIFRDLLDEKVQSEPDTGKIRAALKQGVPCPGCKGIPIFEDAEGIPVEVCPRCEGRGTIPATVAGARLLPRGEHLRVE